MQAFPFTTKSIFYLSVLLVAAASGALPAAAQKPLEPEQKPGETTNVAVVEVTPDQSTVAIGSKLQFKAVAKDASGKTLPDAVKFWYAAPFDAAGADQKRDGQVVAFDGLQGALRQQRQLRRFGRGRRCDRSRRSYTAVRQT